MSESEEAVAARLKVLQDAVAEFRDRVEHTPCAGSNRRYYAIQRAASYLELARMKLGMAGHRALREFVAWPDVRWPKRSLRPL